MLLDRTSLQKYLLRCCQLPEGGFRDKPGKSRDFYHTCYCLSGLSVAQHGALRGGGGGGCGVVEVLGEPQNELPLLHPLYNLRASRVEAARAVFAALPDPLL
jgi:protein farnesyltransferase subunit beta